MWRHLVLCPPPQTPVLPQVRTAGCPREWQCWRWGRGIRARFCFTAGLQWCAISHLSCMKGWQTLASVERTRKWGRMTTQRARFHRWAAEYGMMLKEPLRADVYLSKCYSLQPTDCVSKELCPCHTPLLANFKRSGKRDSSETSLSLVFRTCFYLARLCAVFPVQRTLVLFGW